MQDIFKYADVVQALSDALINNGDGTFTVRTTSGSSSGTSGSRSYEMGDLARAFAAAFVRNSPTSTSLKVT